jgi:hypothetical protein
MNIFSFQLLDMVKNRKTISATQWKAHLLDMFRGEVERADPTPVSTAGSRLVNFSLMTDLIEKMACPNCFKCTCVVTERKRMGVNSTVQVKCQKCGHCITTDTSPKINTDDVNSAEGNILIVSAGKNCGIGYKKTVKFLAGLNVPQPLHLKTYQYLAEIVHDASMKVATQTMEECGKVVKAFYLQVLSKAPGEAFQVAEDGVVPIVVTYDGTWHKRGHSSHYGIGIVIELHSGVVLGFKVLSNYCHGCAIGPKPGEEKYEEWKRNHGTRCQRNYNGSANSMEVAAARDLFPKSLDFGLKYTTVLCDGDSKTIAALKDLDPYDEPITKEDCINHVAKRMFTAIERVKQGSKGTNNPLSGKGKLSVPTQKKLSAYYACQLKNNAPDIVKMRQGVYASLFHSISTDDKPRHKQCPQGSESWCKYQRAIADKEDPPKHSPLFTPEIADHLLNVYDRMTQADLLERCSRMMTQNANECFNAQVWRKCPKTEATSLRSVETACALALIEFNLGPNGYLRVLDELGIVPGRYQMESTKREAVKRLSRGVASMKETVKTKRKRRKMNKVQQQDVLEAAEGQLYGAGCFNN